MEVNNYFKRIKIIHKIYIYIYICSPSSKFDSSQYFTRKKKSLNELKITNKTILFHFLTVNLILLSHTRVHSFRLILKDRYGTLMRKLIVEASENPREKSNYWLMGGKSSGKIFLALSS